MKPLLHLILFEPEIPQNTGNIGRLCAYTQSRLHLIEPLGFRIEDRHLRRSGMDYWHSLDWHRHADFKAFRTSADTPRRIWLFTTKAKRSFWDAAFEPGDGLLFGNEGHGAPDWLHREIGDAGRLRIPSFNPAPLRSLNLASATAIATYEALRQLRAAGCCDIDPAGT